GEQVVLHLRRVVLPREVQADTVLLGNAPLRRVNAAVGIEPAHLRVPRPYLGADRILTSIRRGRWVRRWLDVCHGRILHIRQNRLLRNDGLQYPSPRYPSAIDRGPAAENYHRSYCHKQDQLSSPWH